MTPLSALVVAALLAAAPASAQDCNENGRPDAADISPLAFRAVEVLSGLPGPVGLATADLDADGDADVAVTTVGDHRLRVLLNAGGASFPTVDTIAVGTEPVAVVAAGASARLIGGGSNINLHVADAGSDSVTVLENDGDGTFAEMAGSPFGVGAGPTALVVTDLDGDREPDLLTANTAGDSITLRFGTGGGLGPPASRAAGDSPGAPAISAARGAERWWGGGARGP